MTVQKKTPLIRRPWFAFLSSMRFAVALLSLLAVASIIGTVLQQNQAMSNYVVKFGPFWAEIFGFLGLYDVYASSWFVVIMLFLVISTGLCLWRNVPSFLKEMKSFRTKATAKSLAHMKHTQEWEGQLSPEIAEQYWRVRGYQSKTVQREDGSVLIAAKKGAMNKWGYIFAHVALIVICLGGLIDSNLLLKIGMMTGKIVPNVDGQYVRDFKEESTLGSGNLSFRGNVEVVEGQTTGAVFLNADKGMLLQELPFTVDLKKFHIDFYDTGMPKDFASDIVVTDKKTGEKIEHTIRVNHPLTVNGVTIYQASYGDGGSPLKFDAWNLGGTGVSVPMEAVSQSNYPLDLGAAGKYQIEFGELRVYNVEDSENPQNSEQLSQKINDVRNVAKEKTMRNVGPTITYRLRNATGQAYEYVNYMLPLVRQDALFFATGERANLNEPYRWLMIPADKKASHASFMALRAMLLNEKGRAKIVERAVAGVNPEMKPQFQLAVENLLRQFSEGGYVAINEHIQNTVPAAEQEKTGELMYQILIGAMDQALSLALEEQQLEPMPTGMERQQFLLHSLDAYTALTRFHTPVLLHMTSYTPVNMSGLQMTKSPGASLVYIGSLFLVLGTIFMFYIREKRAWILCKEGKIRFAMATTRNERELNQVFEQSYTELKQLSNETNHQ